MHRTSVMRFLPVALAGILLVAAGCERRGGRHSRAHDDSMVTDSTKMVMAVDSPNGKYEAFFSPAVWPVPLNEVFTINVTVVDEDGDPIETPFAVDADMPAHNHGMNTKPEIFWHEPGRARVDGMLFHMPGEWEVYAHVEEEGGIETITWKVNVELQ